MKNKIILLIAILLILAGTITLFIAGFEKTESYKFHNRCAVLRRYCNADDIFRNFSAFADRGHGPTEHGHIQ